MLNTKQAAHGCNVQRVGPIISMMTYKPCELGHTDLVSAL